MKYVPNIVSMGQSVVKERILKDFEKLGYNILMASEFGVPPNRKRAFFVGTKGNRKFVFPTFKYKELISTKEAILDLPEKSLPDGINYSLNPKSKYHEEIRNGSKGIFNHEISKHSEQTVEIISMIPDRGNYKNLPLELQKARNVNIAWTRLNSEKPSFTIDTGHRHHFHYKFNRIPTVRESARIQSFPDIFIFLGIKTTQILWVKNP